MTLTIEEVIAILTFLVTVFGWLFKRVATLSTEVAEMRTNSEFIRESLEKQIRALDEEVKNCRTEIKTLGTEFKDFQRITTEKYDQIKDSMNEQTRDLTNIINENYKEIVRELRGA